MQIITHQIHINKLPESSLKDHIQNRFNQLSEDTDAPPNIILVEATDDITGPGYAFIGNRGLLSDQFEEHTPGETGFIRPYDWISYIPNINIYEALLLLNGEDSYWVYVPEAIAEANHDLKWIFTDENQGGLSEQQPF